MSLDNTFWSTLIVQYKMIYFFNSTILLCPFKPPAKKMANLTAFDCACQVSLRNDINKVGVQRMLFPLQFWLSKEKKSRDL